jgi:hypothetical protein
VQTFFFVVVDVTAITDASVETDISNELLLRVNYKHGGDAKLLT